MNIQDLNDTISSSSSCNYFSRKLVPVLSSLGIFMVLFSVIPSMFWIGFTSLFLIHWFISAATQLMNFPISCSTPQRCVYFSQDFRICLVSVVLFHYSKTLFCYFVVNNPVTSSWFRRWYQYCFNFFVEIIMLYWELFN